MLHLHGLQHEKGLPGRDRIARRDQHVKHAPGHGCRETAFFFGCPGAGFNHLETMNAAIDVHPKDVANSGAMSNGWSFHAGRSSDRRGVASRERRRPPKRRHGKGMPLMHRFVNTEINHHGYLLDKERKDCLDLQDQPHRRWAEMNGLRPRPLQGPTPLRKPVGAPNRFG
ncbi:MAG: hypothetical protein CM15mP18_2200 [Methanobacteriota archaeon]|nr:MAG: hypothetical protein CM15mP18_2200 [Euryarchaeota archaeon]